MDDVEREKRGKHLNDIKKFNSIFPLLPVRRLGMHWLKDLRRASHPSQLRGDKIKIIFAVLIFNCLALS